MSKPTVVITGANRGLGLEIARALVRAKHPVVLVARDAATGRRTRDELAAAGNVRLVLGDLGDVASVRQTARAIVSEAPAFDVLVHNAGLWPSRRVLNADGVEQAFAVNHLAPFLLNHLLAPALRPGGRVVQVSAGLYVKGKAQPGITARGDDFHAIRTYASTKLCNLLLLERWASLLGVREVTINAVHPGVLRTGLGDRTGLGGLLLRAVKRLWKAPEAGVPPVLRLALAPELAGVTGAYHHLEAATPLAPPACDRALADALWSEAEALCGFARAGHDAQADARAAGEQEEARPGARTGSPARA